MAAALDALRVASGSTAIPALAHSQALDRACDLAPLIRSHAASNDRERTIAPQAIAALRDAGLFRIMTPKLFGGSELGFASLTEITAAVAAACGSTGWVYTVLAGHNWLMSLFPAKAQEEVFGDPSSLIATVVRLGGERPKPAAGGYRIDNASGKYCSGVDYASWIILGAAVETDSGAPEPRYLLVPKSDVEIVDDWFVTGMRGTGSRSLRIKSAFVPAHRSVSIAALARGEAPGFALHSIPVYRAPFPQVLPLSLAGAPLGMARGAVEEFRAQFHRKLNGLGETEIAELSSFFVRLSEASAAVDAATALVLNASRAIDAAPDGAKTAQIERARLMRDIAYGAHLCRTAANNLFEAGSGSGIYEDQAMQRIWRDINAATSHNTFSRERAGGMYARALLGLPPGKLERIGH